MYRDFRVEVLYFAGRRKFMQMNLPILLDHPMVDCVRIEQRCKDRNDELWIANIDGNLVGHRTDKIVVEIPSGKGYSGHYRNAIDDNTIYIKIDDDVIYISRNCIEELLKARCDFPDAKLVFPNIHNNVACDHFFSHLNLNSRNIGSHVVTNKDGQDVLVQWSNLHRHGFDIHMKLISEECGNADHDVIVLPNWAVSSRFTSLGLI